MSEFDNRSPEDVEYGLNLPYHLAEATLADDLCELLTEFEFIEYKVSALAPQPLIDDYELALQPDINLSEEIKDNLRLIQGAIKISANVLADEPRQLPSQLLGRLISYRSRDKLETKSKSWIQILLTKVILYWKKPPQSLEKIISFTRAIAFNILILPLAIISVSLPSKFYLIIGLPALILHRFIEFIINWAFKLICLWFFLGYQVIFLIKNHYSKSKSSPFLTINVLLDKVENFNTQPWLRPLTPSLIRSGESLIRTFKGHTSFVNTIAITPDGTKVISGSTDKSLIVWDIRTGTPLKFLREHASSVDALVITPDGKQIVSGSMDKTIKVWNIETEQDKSIATFNEHHGPIRAIAITPDGKKIISASHDTTLKVWDLQTGQCLCTCREHKKSVSVVAINPDGDKVISGDDDYILILWNLKDGRLLKKIKSFRNAIQAIKITKDGKKVLVATLDNNFELCDISTGTVLKNFTGHRAWINEIAITPDETKVVAASSDFTIKIWKLKTGALLGSFNSHYGADVRAVTITPDGKQVISGSLDNTLKIWNLTSISKTLKIESLTKHIGSVGSLAITPDGKCAISGSDDGSIIIWDISSGNSIKTLEVHNKQITSIVITPNGQKFVSASLDKVVRVWSLPTGKIIANFLPKKEVRALAITSDSRHLILGLDNGDIVIWDLESKTISRYLSESSGSIMAVAITPDGKRIIAGTSRNSLVVWDFKSGNKINVINLLNKWNKHDDSGLIKSIAVTPNSKQLISASSDKTLKLWDIDQGTELKNFSIHTSWVEGVAITPSGRLVVSVSEDETIKVWYLNTGEIIANLSVDTSVRSCAVAGDGLTIVAGDFSGQVHFVRLEGMND